MRRCSAAAAFALILLLCGCGGSTPPGRSPSEAAGNAAFAPSAVASSGAGHRFYEIYDPVGPARGTMLMLHGGGWKDQRGDARRDLTVAALAFRANGWRVVNVSYTPGPPARGSAVDPVPMVRDVVAFYDQIRRAFSGPICAYGESAGGHLAAMLAIERPSLTCAIISAGPLDLPTLMRESTTAGAQAIRATFGTSRALLAAWSPSLLWRRGVDRTAVFATAAANDQIVPPQQLRAFAAVDPAADVAVVPGANSGSADSVPWIHSTVNRAAIDARLEALYGWLDRIAPEHAGASTPVSSSVGRDCGTPRGGAQRWQLLLAGDAWRQSSTPGQLIAATRGCSGSSYWQDDGLSLWALPSTTSPVLPAGSQASLTLDDATPLHRISMTFRGFLARPADWSLGLYAGGHQVAGCDAGACSGMRLASTQSATFALPAGTRAVSWQLRCVAPGGCPVAAATGASGASLRPRDPLAQPAIFSIYRVDVR